MATGIDELERTLRPPLPESVLENTGTEEEGPPTPLGIEYQTSVLPFPHNRHFENENICRLPLVGHRTAATGKDLLEYIVRIGDIMERIEELETYDGSPRSHYQRTSTVRWPGNSAKVSLVEKRTNVFWPQEHIVRCGNGGIPQWRIIDPKEIHPRHRTFLKFL